MVRDHNALGSRKRKPKARVSIVRWNLKEAGCQQEKNAGGQTPEPTNRNHIVGRTGRTSVLDNTKSNAARIPCGKCGGYVGGKLLRLPGEVLQTGSRRIRKPQ